MNEKMPNSRGTVGRGPLTGTGTATSRTKSKSLKVGTQKRETDVTTRNPN